MTPPRKSFWRHTWDVVGFTLVVYAGIAVCVVGLFLLMVVANG